MVQAEQSVIGCLMMAASLFIIPFISPQTGGLIGLLVTIALLAIGNSMASPALTSLASKISDDAEQGKSLGVMQSGASLARAIGPATANCAQDSVTEMNRTCQSAQKA